MVFWCVKCFLKKVEKFRHQVQKSGFGWVLGQAHMLTGCLWGSIWGGGRKSEVGRGGGGGSLNLRTYVNRSVRGRGGGGLLTYVCRFKMARFCLGWALLTYVRGGLVGPGRAVGSGSFEPAHMLTCIYVHSV